MPDTAVAGTGFRITLLRPGEGASLTPGSRINGVGWIDSDQPVSAIDVRLGQVPLARARLNIAPEHLAALTGHHPGETTTGFVFVATVPPTLAGDATLTLRVATPGGPREHSIPVTIARPVSRPSPPPTILRVECEEAGLTDAGALTVKGWAVCSSGVAGIRVEFDGVPVGTAMPSEDRPDVGGQHGGIAGARQSGFRLAVALGRPVQGEHAVRLVVNGMAGEEHAITRSVTAEPVPAPPATAAEEERIRFFLDAPACQDGVAVETVRGFLSLSGWAFSRNGIDRIEVHVDGELHGNAHYGIRREDIDTAFPGSNALRSGFAMMIPPPVMKRGEHDIRLDIHDAAGRRRDVRFKVRAEQASSGPGPWMLRTKIPEAEIQLHHAILAARDWAPRWALVLAAGEGKQEALRRTLESLRWQAYEAWSLVIVADTQAALRQAEAVAAGLDDILAGRVRIIAARPRRQLADLAGDAGALVALTPGDRLGEDALLELSLAGALEPGADFIYSDERRIDPADGEEKAFFKPDFSPDLLLSTNYIGRLWSASSALLRAAGLREADLWGLGDYHAVLALTERARRIVHIPKVLCHAARRTGPRKRDRSAIQAALSRRQVTADVLPGAIPGSYRIERAVPPGGLVSIIIPTIASKGLVKTTIESIRAHTDWPEYEIVCVDNIPAKATAEQRTWKRWLRANADRTIEANEPFNWSRLNNLGAAAAGGDFLLFLNDDVEVHDPRWLHGLVAQARRPEVGVVGPRLLYPDGQVQHAGMFLGRQAGRHAFRYYHATDAGPFGLALTQREVISVTGACMMMRRDVFDAFGGFDERHDIVNNDLDFNLRVGRGGLSVVYTPAVSLTHHEMVSRAELDDSHDTAHFASQWGDQFRRGDPFFSRRFSPDYDDHVVDAEPVQCLTTGHPLVARDKVRRILAVKVDHIGDFVTAFPAFRRIKHCFPAAHLTVLAAKASMALASLEPAIDAVIEFNFFHARSENGRRPVDARTLSQLRAQLAPERFDLAIDLRRQPETRPVLQASGARWLAGFERGYEHPWLDFALEFEGDLALKYKHGHIADALISLVDTVSAGCEADRRVVLAPPARDAGRAYALSLAGEAARERLGGRRLVCVHTGAGAINKQWPAHSFAGLIDLLISREQVGVAIIGAPDEMAFALTVIQLVRQQPMVFNLVGKAGLGDLARLLRGADLYVGNDSGPKHIAAAIGVPTIGIHSGTVDPGEWGPMGPAAMLVRRNMTCSPCYLAYAADCHRSLACLTGLGVGDVYEACRRMLALGPGVLQPAAPVGPQA